MIPTPCVVRFDIEKLDLFEKCVMREEQFGDPFVVPGGNDDPEQFPAADRGGKIGIRRDHRIETVRPGLRIARPAQIDAVLAAPFGRKGIAEFPRGTSGRK